MHISDQDFRGFLLSPTLRCDFIQAGRKVLIAVKPWKQESDLSLEEIDERLAQLEARYCPRGLNQANAPIFTKAACREFGLQLYLLDFAKDWTAREVLIPEKRAQPLHA